MNWLASACALAALRWCVVDIDALPLRPTRPTLGPFVKVRAGATTSWLDSLDAAA